MILNRFQREQIGAKLGNETVEEVGRWNDGIPDSLTNYGVDLNEQEEHCQQGVLERLAAAELLEEDVRSTLDTRRIH